MYTIVVQHFHDTQAQHTNKNKRKILAETQDSVFTTLTLNFMRKNEVETRSVYIVLFLFFEPKCIFNWMDKHLPIFFSFFHSFLLWTNTCIECQFNIYERHLLFYCIFSFEFVYVPMFVYAHTITTFLKKTDFQVIQFNFTGEGDLSDSFYYYLFNSLSSSWLVFLSFVEITIFVWEMR